MESNVSLFAITGILFWICVGMAFLWFVFEASMHFVKCLIFSYRIKKHRPKFKPFRFAMSIFWDTPDSVTFQNPHMRFEWNTNEKENHD